MFTSGTTGEPKGVMHTHNTLVAAIEPLPVRLGVGSDSVIHMASTVAYTSPACSTGCGCRPSWGRPASTRMCGVTSGSSNSWPKMAVVSGWGQTEDALVTLSIPGDPEKVIERDGYPLPGMRIRVVDEVGTVLPADPDGRLQVTGPFLFAGYAKRLEMTRELFDGEWFDTGDMARIDPDGYLKISGRTKDVIIRGGENIPVAYVENALYEHPKIAAVAVIGLSDPRLQERACACVVLRPGAGEFTFTEMQQFLHDKGIARQYWPERLEVLAEFPSTASGKIQKYRLREAIASAS